MIWYFPFETGINLLLQMISVRIFKSKSQWKLGCYFFTGSFQNKNILEQSVYSSWQARLILWPAAGCSHGAFPLSPPVSKWTSCNKWRQIASASLNNGDYRLEGGETKGRKTNSVWRPPNHLGQQSKGSVPRRWPLGATKTCRSGFSKAKTATFQPKHAGQDFLQWKLPLLGH